MVFLARRNKRLREPGFTLLELLLTVVLLLGLLAAIVFNFTTLKTGATLEEGSRQFQALIHFAAAQAANSGRVVQFRFENVSTNESADTIAPLRIVREVDPVGQPGVFEDLPEAAPLLAEVMERVCIAKVKAAERPPNLGTNEVASVEEESLETPPISFFPDGSSDAVDITLASRDPDDFREVILHLAGVTGTIRAEMKHYEEWTPLEWMEDEKPKEQASVQPRAEPVTQRAEMPETTELPAEPKFDQTTSTNVFDEEWP